LTQVEDLAMLRAHLALGLLLGCAALTPGKVGAEEALAPVKTRQVTLNLKQAPLKTALEKVFAPGGLRVVLEADVPRLALNLSLKDVEEDVAFRLLMRQAKKQAPELEYAPTDDGYRIFLATAKKEAKASPYPVTPLPKVLVDRGRGLPVVQNREFEPLAAALLERAENGEPLLPSPGGASPLTIEQGGFGPQNGGGLGNYSGPGGYDNYGNYGNFGGFGNYDPYALYRDDLRGYDLGQTGLNENSPAYKYLERNLNGRQRNQRDPGPTGRVPFAGGGAGARTPGGSPARGGPGGSGKNGPGQAGRHLPGPYFGAQWISEPRMKFWTNPGSGSGRGGPRGNGKPDQLQTGGGGFAPGGFFTGR
jgi:hypothetical protein